MVKRFLDSDSDDDTEYHPSKKIKLTPNKYNTFMEDLFDDNKKVFQNLVYTLNKERGTSDFRKKENYLDYVMKIPFNRIFKNPIKTHSQKVNFLKRAREKLDKVIYGHSNIKTEILCFIVNYLQNTNTGSILGIEGVAGCGKTELIKNGLGDILNRPVYHLSLGGITDGSFIDGFDYCYEKSKWGIIVDILMRAKSLNPIIFFDELDKVSKGSHGDEIINKLIHIIDPVQNSTFKDRFFKEFEIDLSNIIFIFSFNDKTKINKILLDRINVIQMKNYSSNDKLVITKDFILPKLFKEFKVNNISLTDDCLKSIISSILCNEESSGIREIKNILSTLLMRINLYKFIPPSNIHLDFNEPLDITFELFTKIYSVDKERNEKYLSMYL